MAFFSYVKNIKHNYPKFPQALEKELEEIAEKIHKAYKKEIPYEEYRCSNNLEVITQGNNLLISLEGSYVFVSMPVTELPDLLLANPNVKQPIDYSKKIDFQDIPENHSLLLEGYENVIEVSVVSWEQGDALTEFYGYLLVKQNQEETQQIIDDLVDRFFGDRRVTRKRGNLAREGNFILESEGFNKKIAFYPQYEDCGYTI
jgi:hypothetical protein